MDLICKQDVAYDQLPTEFQINHDKHIFVTTPSGKIKHLEVSLALGLLGDATTRECT